MAKKQNRATSTKRQDKRRYPRISIKNELSEASAILGAHVIWPDESMADVFDMSYTGAAVGLPKDFEIKIGDIASLVFELSGKRSVKIATRLVWTSETVAGVDFGQLDYAQRSLLDDFLEDKLIGQHLRQVSSEHFDKGVDFTHWYHGPHNTNVFLWIHSKGSIEKAIVYLDGDALIFEDNQFQKGGEHIEWDVQATYSAEALPNKEAGEEDILLILDKEAPLVRRVVEILSQIKDQEKPLNDLLNAMAKASG